MKIFQILLVAFLMMIGIQAHGAHQLYADYEDVNIPYGTKLELRMAENITTKSVVEGDMFQANLIQDIYVNNKLILPSQTIFRGRVAQVKYSRSLFRPASLYLNLDHLVTTRGMQLPINSGIASDFEYILKPDGALTTNSNYFKATSKDLKKAWQIIPKAVKWGASSGDEMFAGAQFIFTPLAFVGGTVACVSSGAYNTVANLFRHGDEIIIRKGTKFHIILLSKLEIPI